MSPDPATAAFYDVQASAYAAETVRLDMSEEYARFLPRLTSAGHILDAGSGSGRDTLAFLRKGYRVTAFDASLAMCDRSSALTGQCTQNRTFADVEEVAEYDGVWVSAALLHLGREELRCTWARLIRATKVRGSIYASFKRGTGEVLASDGRRFTLIDDGQLSDLITDQCLTDVEVRHSRSIAGRDENWLSVVATRAEA